MWLITMLLVHLAGFSGVVLLYRRAPCWMQKLTMLGLAVGMAICAVAFGFALSGHVEYRWPIFMLGLLIEHLAVLLYVFRLIFRDHLEWNSSAPSHPSLR